MPFSGHALEMLFETGAGGSALTDARLETVSPTGPSAPAPSASATSREIATRRPRVAAPASVRVGSIRHSVG